MCVSVCVCMCVCVLSVSVCVCVCVCPDSGVMLIKDSLLNYSF